MPRIHQPLQHAYQPPHVGYVQPDRWLFQDQEIAFWGPDFPSPRPVMSESSPVATSFKPVKSCVTSLTRWASPPLSVVLVWLSFR